MIIPNPSNLQCSVLKEIQNSLEGYLLEGVFRYVPYQGIVYANNALINLLGYHDLADLQSVPLHCLYADKDGKRYIVDKLSVDNIVVDYRVLLRKKSGVNFWAVITCKKSVSNNHLVFDGRVYDISQLIVAEEQAKGRNNELEKLTMELDRFIYSASHDIRSPISTLLGITNLMKIEIKEELSLKYIAMIEATVTKLDLFVGELTSFEKNSKSKISDVRLDLSTLVNNIISSLKKDSDKAQSISISVACSFNDVFYSDPERVHLVLFNLLKNAIDYSDVNKSLKLISVEIKNCTNKVVIEIFDNGIGIAHKHLPYVFDMFYRASHQSKGSGIGLYIVREAITKLNGTISIHSEYGVGTSICMEIPNSRKGQLINRKKRLVNNR